MKPRLPTGAMLPLLGLSLLAPASAHGHDPAFVARTELLNPIIAGCAFSIPRIALYPDYVGVLSYYMTNTGWKTLNFDAAGHGGFSHVGGNSSRSVDFALLDDHRFVLVSEHLAVNAIWVRVYDPPTFPTTTTLEAEGDSWPVIDADPSTAASVMAWAVQQPVPGIFAAFFDGAPLMQGSPLPVASPMGDVRGLDILRYADGSFDVIWEEDPSGAAGNQVWLRRFAAAGTPLGPQVPVFEGPFERQLFPNAARAADGAAALVYASPANSAIELRLLQDGALGAPFQAWSHADHPATRAKVAFLAGGDLAVAIEVHLSGGAGSIFLLRFDREGRQVGSTIRIATPTLSYRTLSDPQVATAGDRLAVAYQITDEDRPCQVRLQLFDATLFADSFESGDLSAWSSGL